MKNKPEKKVQTAKKIVTPQKATVKKGAAIGVEKWVVASILIFTTLLYAKALFNDFANWDDDDYLLKNPFLKDFSLKGISAIFSSFYFGNYHPLTTLTYLTEYSVFGLNPLPFHLVNVALHVTNTWLVYKLSEKLSGKSITGIIVALLFAAHPMHVESVAWISERKDLLYTLFYLSATLAYIRYSTKEKFDRSNYILALLLFVASLLSKSAAVTLPVLLIATDIYKKRKITFKTLIEKVPFLLLSLLFGILAIMSQHSSGAINSYTLSYNIVEKIFLFSYTIIFYIVKIVAPFNLSAMYFYPGSGDFHWQYYASLPALFLLLFFVVRKNAFRKEIIFGTLFFLITISVMLQIIPVGSSLVCDRYTYVSYTGLFFLAGQWISSVWTKKIKNVAVFVLAIFILMFSVITWNRIGVWKDGVALFTDVIEKYPDNYLGYKIRGDFRNDRKDALGALEDYNISIKLFPLFAKTFNNRGLIYYDMGNNKMSISDFNEAISIEPDFAEAYFNRANAYKNTGDVKQSISDYSKAISLKPGYSIAYNNRGLAYEMVNDIKSALNDYNKAIEIKPDLAKAYNNRSVIKAKEGKLDDAISDINIAISLEPDSAGSYSNRGNIKAMKKDFRGSVEDFSLSLKLDPHNMMVCYNRALAYLNLKDTASACEDWKTIIAAGDKSLTETVKKYCR